MNISYCVISEENELKLLAALQSREFEDSVSRCVQSVQFLEAVETAQVGEEVVGYIEDLNVVVALESIVSFLYLVDLVAADVEENEVGAADGGDFVNEVRTEVDVLQTRPVDCVFPFSWLAVEAGQTGDLVLPEV